MIPHLQQTYIRNLVLPDTQSVLSLCCCLVESNTFCVAKTWNNWQYKASPALQPTTHNPVSHKVPCGITLMRELFCLTQAPSQLVLAKRSWIHYWYYCRTCIYGDIIVCMKHPRSQDCVHKTWEEPGLCPGDISGAKICYFDIRGAETVSRRHLRSQDCVH